jgi:hypothetical protein
MNIKGKAEIDLNNLKNSKINISDIDYELKLKTNNLGIMSKQDEGSIKNGITINSSYGPINISMDVTTKNNLLNDNIADDFNIIINGNYKIEDNLQMGLKYDTNIKEDGHDIISGVIKTDIKLNDLKLNLKTENILYGKETIEDNEYSVYGNTINPSISLLNDNFSVGYVYNNIEKCDEYGNNDDTHHHKLKLNIDLSL